jgi:hypothetical protein
MGVAGRIVRRRLEFVIAVGCLAAAQQAGAFTFSDGTSATCVARGESVLEYSPPPGSEVMNFTGKTVKVGSGYQIVWKVPTTDEVEANCVGLKDMRAAGRAGLAVEAKLAAFYGANNGYWVSTLRCANAEVKPAGAVRPAPP